MSSLPADAAIVSRHEGGAPLVVILKGRHTIDGIACADMIHLHENGRLAYCVLAEPRTIGAFELDVDDTLYLRADGIPEQIHFRRPREILGHHGVSSVRFDEHGLIERMTIGTATLDARGIVRERRLATATMIGGVSCIMYARFDAEGHLLSTKLAEALATPHGTIPAGSTVTFHPDGSVKRAQVSSDCVLAGQKFERNDPANFSADTVVKEGWVFYTPLS